MSGSSSGSRVQSLFLDVGRKSLLQEWGQSGQLVDVDRAAPHIFNYPTRAKEQLIQRLLTQGFGIDGEERLIPMFTRRVQGASDLFLPQTSLADQEYGLKRRRLDAHEFLQLDQVRADADEAVEWRRRRGALRLGQLRCHMWFR